MIDELWKVKRAGKAGLELHPDGDADCRRHHHEVLLLRFRSFSSQLNNTHVAADATNIRGDMRRFSAQVQADKVSTERRIS